MKTKLTILMLALCLSLHAEGPYDYPQPTVNPVRTYWMSVMYAALFQPYPSAHSYFTNKAHGIALTFFLVNNRPIEREPIW